MIHSKEPNFPARYRIDGVDLYDIHEMNRHAQMLQEVALAGVLAGAKKKEWVGLTEEEMFNIFCSRNWVSINFESGIRGIALDFPTGKDFIRAIEAKLKEKNA